jgi:hypothetical protein
MPAMNLLLISLAVVASAVSLNASDPENPQEAVARLQQAVSKTNIFELPSFVMKAKVQIELKGKMVDGTYQLLWNGKDEWREEIVLPEYAEIQVGGKGMLWVKRSADFIPLRIYNIQEALGFGSDFAVAGALRSGSLVRLGLPPDVQIKKTHRRTIHGEPLTCTEIEDEQEPSSEICVSDRSGTIVRGSTYLDKNLQPAGAKLFPRSLSFLNAGKTVASVTVTDFVTPVQIPAEAFKPPAGAQGFPGCMNPEPFQLLKRRTPEYPESARMQHSQGTVAIEATIGSDGVPRIGSVLESPGPDLARASSAAFRDRRYRPALCGDQPVEIETILVTGYSLSYRSY